MADASVRQLYNIGILTTLWKRHDLESLVMEYYRCLHIDGINLVRVAVGSEGAVSRFNAESSGFHYVEAPNDPLSDKWNAGMRYLKDKVDAVILVGSDDILSESAIRTLVAEWENGADMVGLEDLWYYEDGRLYESIRSHPGAGTILGASVLMRVDWEPWPKGIDRRLDGHMTNRLHTDGYPCRCKYIDKNIEKGLLLVDIKSDVNMWSSADMAQMTGRVNEIPVERLDEAFPGLRDLVNQTKQDNG